MQKIILSLFLSLIFISASVNSISAQGACPGSCKPSCSPTESQNVGGCASGNVCCVSNFSPNSDPTCNGGSGIDTAIGCVPITDTNTFVSWFLGWSIGVGGGIAFLLIIYASFMIMTSQGDPPRLKAGQEVLTSAISGIIMLIFSVFILNFIGFDILGLDLL